MGAYIVGLNKPENEKDCNFYEEVFMRPFPYCHLIHKSCAGLEHCPIIEIREPHGRLIDADALCASHKEVCSRSMKFNLDLAPTVIPASESEERPAFLPTYELTPRREEAE